MASNSIVPRPPTLDIHDSNAAEKWKQFKTAWKFYSVANEINEKEQNVQVASMLSCMGVEAQNVYQNMTWAAGEDKEVLEHVQRKFDAYVEPRKNVPFQRYKFNTRSQASGESFDQYISELRNLAVRCEFDTVTPEELLRDRIIFGIKDDDVRARLLRVEGDLTLQRTIDVCRAAETSQAQLKAVGKTGSPATVNALKGRKGGLRKSKTATKKGDSQCKYCGNKHEFVKEKCPAWGKTCDKCHGKNHFKRMCSKKKAKSVKQLDVDDVDDESEEDDGEDRVFQIGKSSLRDAEAVTLEVDTGNFIRFQLDTGAKVNVLPLHIYKGATKDFKLKKLKHEKSVIQSYGGGRTTVLGEVQIRVRRLDLVCRLNCKVVEGEQFTPILGRKACLGMNLIKMKDCDAIRKPDTAMGQVFTVSDHLNAPVLSKEQLLREYKDVFKEEVGLLEGDYKIRLDPAVKPVKHAPRRGRVAERKQTKEALDDLEKRGMIKKVTEPTDWESSMVTVKKPNGRLRICLDPKDLNEAIMRETYPMPTIEDVASRLHGAKVFTVLDVKSGFWHVKLDEESSLLTTFHTPFGRYRWTRMPFGISSAPEVFQRKMHELIEGLRGVEVIADDFAVIGYGDTLEEGIRDHDRNLRAFLQRCRERNVTLGSEKLRLRRQEVEFIGHVATGPGLRVDPKKIDAIVRMPTPETPADVSNFLGMVQYLSKFLPRLSDMSYDLRQLTHKSVEFKWEPEVHGKAFEMIKKAVCLAPVLRYYSLNDEVTIQCDASQYGLGAALLQNGQPVSFASRVLTDAQTRYAQIEKEHSGCCAITTPRKRASKRPYIL